MPSHRSVLIGITVAGSFWAAAPTWATIDNLKSYKEAYPGKEPKAYSCKVCHEHPIGRKGDLNAYGQALEKLKGEGKAKKLGVEDYRAAEADDADGDGVSNGDEIQAGTDPVDPQSVPENLEPHEEKGAEEGVELEQESEPEPEEPPSPSSHLAPWERHRLQAYLKQWVMPEAFADTQPPSAEKAAKDPSKEEMPRAEYVGTETCAGCHVKEHKEFKHSTHARISVPGLLEAQGCESCHGAGSLHVEAGGGRGVGGIINPRKDPSTCFACHLDKKAEFRLPYHHPLLERKMSCADCHNPHGQDVRPWSATTLQGINEACFKCHKEQRGPFVWEHEALREGCTTCHKVHGSIHDKMLVVRDNNLCLRCHTQVNFPTIGKSNHASRLPNATCFSGGCHTAPHGSNFDEHLRY